MRCIGDVIQELLAAHESGRDVNLVIWHISFRCQFILKAHTQMFAESRQDAVGFEVLAGVEPSVGGHHRCGADRAQEGPRAQVEGEASQDGVRGE